IQPTNLSPTYRQRIAIERNQLLVNIAKRMDQKRQRLINEEDQVFYLEDFGLDIIVGRDRQALDKYRGFVSLFSVVVFMSLYGFFILFLSAVHRNLPTLFDNAPDNSIPIVRHV